MSEFVEAVRVGDWARATLLVQEHDVSPLSEAPSTSIYSWLVELNAPPRLVADLLRLHPEPMSLDRAKADVVEACLREATTKANASATLALLLTEGLSPNLIVDGGSTFLQRAMELNRVAEVRELLRHGVDPRQKSICGRESTTNLEEAQRIGNEAAEIALASFVKEEKRNLL